MGRSEELGTGVQNVFKYNKYYSNTQNNIFKEEDVFITTVPLKALESDNVVDNVVDIKLKTILKLIESNNRISANKISDKLGVSSRTVQRYIKLLKENNKLKRIGDDKTGYWKIL